MPWHPAAIFLGLLFALPLVAAFPLATSITRVAVTASPLYLYTVGILLVMAAWIGSRDRWMGALTAWVGVSLLWTPTMAAFESVETIIMSAVAIMVLRTVPQSYHPWFLAVLVAVGLFQVVDGVQQYLGYDVLWHGLTPIQPVAAIFGTTGNSNYYGMLLAMVAPLAPWWAVPFFLLGIILAHSLLGMVAVTVALLWRVRASRVLIGSFVGIAVIGMGLILFLKGSTPLSGFQHRLAVWDLALHNLTWKGWLVGAGPGTWATHIPSLQIQQGVYPHEVFLQGHNEWLQLLYEHGLVAMGCLAGWLWGHRQVLTGPYGPSLLAMAFAMSVMFGFRLAMTGCVAVVLIGLALAHEGTEAV